MTPKEFIEKYSVKSEGIAGLAPFDNTDKLSKDLYSVIAEYLQTYLPCPVSDDCDNMECKKRPINQQNIEIDPNIQPYSCKAQITQDTKTTQQ